MRHEFKPVLEQAYRVGLRVSKWVGLGKRDALMDDKLVRFFGKGSAWCRRALDHWRAGDVSA